MFARTFAVKVKGGGDPAGILKEIEERLSAEVVGRKLFPFVLFADAEPKLKKLVFYDMTVPEHTIEFASLYGRLPEFCVDCDTKTVKLYCFLENNEDAKVFKVESAGDGQPVTGLKLDEEVTAKEKASLGAVVSTTRGFITEACSMDGTVTCSIRENQVTKEKRSFFSVRVDARPDSIQRAILRSCRKMHFAWSEDDVSYMIFLCRFRMLPAFAVSFPIVGANIQDAMEFYMKHQKGVGIVLYKDDVSDAFTIENSQPTFEEDKEGA